MPQDANGQTDVYLWEEGQPYLISAGTGREASKFLDASPSGNDVFFATSQRLVGWDIDDSFDVYDARVDGGLPEPPAGVIGCEGDACQPPPNPPNDPTPASATFNGSGNVKPAHKKKHHRKRHHKKRHGARKHAKKNLTPKNG